MHSHRYLKGQSTDFLRSVLSEVAFDIGEVTEDRVRELLTGIEPEFHGNVPRKELEDRIRNSVAAVSAGYGRFCAVLFSLKLSARWSITFTP